MDGGPCAFGREALRMEFHRWLKYKSLQAIIIVSLALAHIYQGKVGGDFINYIFILPTMMENDFKA
jgi:hypothetical protein